MAAKEKESTELQAASAAGVPDFLRDLADEASQFAGAGTSNKADDNVLPFLSLLQDMSPEAKKRDPKYVDGAEPGFMLNKATRQLWASAAEGGGDVPLIVQPCAFQRVINEWVPRDQGGGFVARHEYDDSISIEARLEELGGRKVPKPGDSTGKKFVWRNGEGHDLIDTRYHYVNIIMPDGTTQAAVMSFSSTGHTSSRSWMTLMRNAKIPGVGVAPSWFKKYRVRALPRQNDSGDFFVLTLDDLGAEGWIADAEVRAAGQALFESFRTGAVKAGVESDEEVGGAAGDNGESPI